MTAAPGTTVWFARHEFAAGVARLAVDDHGRPARAPAPRRHRDPGLCDLHALRRLLDGRPLRRCRRRQVHAGDDHRQHFAVVALDGVAGDGIDDARVLFALRSRSHPRFSGRRHQIVCHPHRHRCDRHGVDGDAACRAVHQCADRTRRLALAWRLRADRCYGRDRNRARGRSYGCAVPPDRTKTHAAHRANRCGGDRRGLRHRPASRCDPVLRHDLAGRGAAIAGRRWRMRPISTAWCGGRRVRR